VDSDYKRCVEIDSEVEVFHSEQSQIISQPIVDRFCCTAAVTDEKRNGFSTSVALISFS